MPEEQEQKQETVREAWKNICAACAEGTPPERCAYYGEPNGCNAPTLGAHPEGDLAERLQEALEKAERRIAELERAPGNAAAMREAIQRLLSLCDKSLCKIPISLPLAQGNEAEYAKLEAEGKAAMDGLRAALAAPPHKGRWKNGRSYEYEYAYCSECGRMQWAGWDTHKQAEENIESFAHDYKFCPGCGAEMEGGVYVQ